MDTGGDRNTTTPQRWLTILGVGDHNSTTLHQRRGLKTPAYITLVLVLNIVYALL
jgi:hypothetical protein